MNSVPSPDRKPVRIDSLPQIPPSFSLSHRAHTLLGKILLPLNLLISRWKLARYLASHSQPKLHIGCGANLLPGWMNTDAGTFLSLRGRIFLDARKRLPFRDSSLQYIFNEHFITCLRMDEAMSFFRECFRVLKPGGVLRIATPLWPFFTGIGHDPSSAGEQYRQWFSKAFLETPSASPCMIVNYLLYGFHIRSVYDLETLQAMLRGAGFDLVLPQPFRKSAHPELCALEAHNLGISMIISELETSVLEAAKPSSSAMLSG